MIPINEPNLRRIEYNRLVHELELSAERGSHKDLTPIIEKIKILEEFSSDKKRFFALFSHVKFFPVYGSDNIVREGGYTFEEIRKLGLFMVFRHIHWTQLTLAYKIIKLGGRFRQTIGKNTLALNDTVYFVGIKFKDKWGKWRTILIKQKVLRATKNNAPSLSFLEVEEITPIYNANFVWFRITNTTDNQFYCRTYFCSGAKQERADLLSARELEILQLIVQKKSSKEIGEQLSISVNTVLRHRKNMIARAGVTDMTALIQVCQMCQIL